MTPPAAPQPGSEETVPSEDAFLLRYLETHDAPCPGCGYNLHALTAPRCPECGRAVRIKVVRRDPGAHAWIVMTAATAASAGTGLLFTLIHPPHRFERPPGSWAAAYLYAAMPITALLVLARRRITALPTWLQALAAAVFALLWLVSLMVAIVML